MKAAQPAPTTIDAYIAAFPPDVQAILEQIHKIVRFRITENAEQAAAKGKKT